MHNQSKGIWLDQLILNIKGLSVLQKLFLAEIDNLGRVEGCWATNDHFAKLFDMSKNRCSEIINTLCDKGFLIKSFEEDDYGNERRILSLLPIVEKSTGQSRTRQERSRTRLLYKDEIKIYITTTTGAPEQIGFSKEKAIDELLKNQTYVDSVMCTNKLKNIDTLKAAAERFVNFQIGIGKVYNNLGDFKTHFSSWTKSQGLVDSRLKDVDIEESLDWFMKTFNTLSRKEYKATKRTRELFEIQLSVGYTGPEMVQAISNLYSAKNTWHKKNGYVEATPDFLLTDGRMNKFLNAKY